MFYVIIRRILRRHAFFHLVIPLVVGILVEMVYANVWAKEPWDSSQLVSGHRIALYAGVISAYITVIAFLIRSETNFGLRRIELNDLAAKMHGARSLFAVAPTPLGEWFDPAAQVYFATLLGGRLSSGTPLSTLRYERVLLLPSRKSRTYLNSDYLDGYFAKCLIEIHKRLGILLYFLEWDEIDRILEQLTVTDKIAIGYYPPVVAHLPKSLAKAFILPIRRRRVKRIACGVIENSDGTYSVFRFAKRENVVDVKVQPVERAEAYLKFVECIKGVLYGTGGTVKVVCDFSKYYSD